MRLWNLGIVGWSADAIGQYSIMSQIHALHLTVRNALSKGAPEREPLKFEQAFPNHYLINDTSLEKFEAKYGKIENWDSLSPTVKQRIKDGSTDF